MSLCFGSDSEEFGEIGPVERKHPVIMKHEILMTLKLENVPYDLLIGLSEML